MADNVVIVVLVLFILAREVLFHYTTHKFVNKIMSNNFHDYQQSITLAKTEPKAQPKVQEEFEEDLGSLNGIGIL